MRSPLIGGMSLLALSLAALPLTAQDAVTYQKPPKAIMDVIVAPRPPRVSFNSSHDTMLLWDAVPNPDIAELAQPMLRIAGIRIDPASNALHATARVKNLRLERVSDGRLTPVVVPAALTHLTALVWSPDGKRFAFSNISNTAGVSLWVGDAATGAVHQLAGVRLDPVVAPTPGSGFSWLAPRPSTTLIVYSVPALRGRAPAQPAVATGPVVQESDGTHSSGEATYEDLLKTPHDEDLFTYYATSQLALVNVVTGAIKPVGKPAIYTSTTVSPDGRHLMVSWIHKPYSYLVPDTQFPHKTELWDMTGKMEMAMSDTSLSDGRGGAGGGRGAGARGPRGYAWMPGDPATLMWEEPAAPAARGAAAADDQAAGGGGGGRGGRLRTDTPADKVMTLVAPFNGTPVEYMRTEHRVGSLAFGSAGTLGILRDTTVADGDRVFFFDPKHPDQRRLAWTHKTTTLAERNADPGTPASANGGGGRGGAGGGRGGAGVATFLQDGKYIYLESNGPSADGDHPFLDRFDTEALTKERIFQSPKGAYETVAGIVPAAGGYPQLLIAHESVMDPPNYYERQAGAAATGLGRALTHYTDPVPQVRQIAKKLVEYKRADGVTLSMTVYFPPGYKDGDRPPAIVWAYPAEFDNADDASAVTGSPDRWVQMTGYSELYLCLDGYVILDNMSMPIVSKDGNAAHANDTYVEQLVEDATDGVNEAARLGYIDPNRVGVAGHSYGAFMTANLLAHSQLFKAGNAQSGAYNRSLTPFGFQNERRTYWQDPKLYQDMSPFNYADKITAPLLLMHGMADSNSGTFPIQSERMYDAIEGNGGTVRFVYLPYEAHGYLGEQTIEDVLWEMDTWFNKYVKNLAPVHRPPARGAADDGGNQ